MDDYRPTKEELAVINERFAKEPFKSVEDLYAFPAMIIDNKLTAYFTRVHPTFLEQCVKDLFNGVGFLVGHDRDKLPMARSFKGHLTSDGDTMEVFAKFFMQKDLEVNGVNTDDFMRAFLGGTIEDVSIGFAAKRYECSICHNDIRSPDCPHWPGKKYNDKNEEDEKGTLCFAWVMEPGGPSGEALLEVSAVYKGAAPAAKQRKASDVPKFIINLSEGKSLKEMSLEEAIAMNFNFPEIIPKGGEKVFDIDKFFAGEYSKEELEPIGLSAEDIDAILAQEVSKEEAGILKDKFKEQLSDLLKEYPAFELLVDDGQYARWTRAYINSLPDSSFAVIEPAYSKGETKNKNARHLPHHNEKGGGTSNENLDLPHLRNAMARMNQIQPVTDSISTEELRSKAATHLEHHRSALEGGRQEADFIKLEEDLKTSQANNKVLLEQNTTLTSEVNQLKTEIETIKQANVNLQKEMDNLKLRAADGEKYREDLINETLELGIKLNGNNFDKATYENLLKESARTIDDIKKIRDQFLKELCERFPGSRQTTSPPLGLPGDNLQGSTIPDEAFKS